MGLLLSTVLAASTVKAVGVVIAVITGIGFVAYAIINVRAGRAEIASEIELAPNRKPYYDDEALEGPRLDPRARHRLRAHGHRRDRPAPLLAQRAGATDRCDRELRPDLHQPWREALRTHGRRWVQLRRLPRR